MILRWYKDTQEGKAKGKTVFLEQMSAFIDWLKNAEEEGAFTFRHFVVTFLFLSVGRWN